MSDPDPARHASAPRPPLSRRRFLHQSSLVAAAAALLAKPSPLLAQAGADWLAAVQVQPPATTAEEALSGLIAFVVPGPDAFSQQQGVSTATAGGLDAGVLPALVDSLDGAAPYAPQFSAIVAGILDNVASLVNPTAPGAFASPFARLSAAEKAVVLGLLESDPAAAALFGILPALVAFLCYSEAGALDPATRTLAGRPVGWEITGYPGAADGRAEFRGYFQNRRRAAGA